MISRAVLLALLLSSPLLAVAEPAPVLFRLFAEQPAATDCIEVDVDLAHGEAPEAVSGTLRYPLRGKEITEGWSWPETASSEPDYYRYKYLPLASESEDRHSYEAEDKIGERQTMTERWRHDYFLAFGNFASFVDPSDDDAALVLTMPADFEPAHLALRAEACLTQPTTRESTTFWKATHATPVDLTLKKRYLIGELRAVHVYDLLNGRRLATLQACSPPTRYQEGACQ